MTSNIFRYAILLAVAGTTFSSCSKNEGTEEDNDEEVITTVRLTFVPAGGGTSLTYQYNDADGPGGLSPVQDEIVLAPSKTYSVSIQLLNAVATPAEDITLEVKEESAAHRFYYLAQAGANITIAGMDNDINGVPLGVTSTWTTGAAATGKVQIVLRHYPGNPPGKLATDLVTDSKSGTDVDVSFTTKVQ